MRRSTRLFTIVFILALSFSCSGTLFAGQRDARGGTSKETLKEKLVCLPNAPTYMGIHMEDLTDSSREDYKYPHESGVVVTDVVEDGPADKAGIEDHDIIYQFGDAKITNTLQLCALVQKRKPDDSVRLVVYRDGERHTFNVTLGRRETTALPSPPAYPDVEEALRKARESGTSLPRMYLESSRFRGRLGVVTKDLNEDLAPYFNMKGGDGVLVLEVTEDSPAAEAGIKAGDVIRAIGGATVSDAEDLSEEVSKADEGDTLAVELVRRGAKRTVDVVVGSGDFEQLFSTAPFEWKVQKLEKPGAGIRMELTPADRRKLEKDVQALKERIKELEERLGKIEKEE